MGKYFSRFPTINYKNSLTKNLLARVKILDSVKKQSTVFYPYTMKEGDRLDTVSYDYYDNSYYDWLICLSNGIINPYYDAYISPEDFDGYIIAKYGSLESAQSQILFYRNDWTSDDSRITVSAYENLPSNLKKYWTATTDQYDSVNGYNRKEEDWIVSTNQILSLSVNTNAEFVSGETITTSNSFATLNFANSSVIIVQNVEGEFLANTTATSSQSNNTITINDVVVLANTIDPTERGFYVPVDAYTYETELNSTRKEIKVLDNRFVNVVEQDMKRLFG